MNYLPRWIGFAFVGSGLLLLTGCIVETRVISPAPAPAPVVRRVAPAPDPVHAIRERALRGDAAAQFILGSCYANGRGVPRNDVEAARWYRYSAERGYAAAQNRLGVCYLRGLGVQRNFVVAADWFRRGAIQGYALAQDNLGACYSSGRGVLLNHAEALKWYRLAAAQGNASAQNHLGLCYLKGLGVRQNVSEAAAWFAKAAAQGNASAKINLQLCQTRNPSLPATQPAPTVQTTAPTVPNQPTPSPAIEPAESSGGDPLTVDEIKIAASAGVKPESLIEQIQSSNSKFSAQDIAAAQQAGIDPAVIACMRANER